MTDPARNRWLAIMAVWLGSALGAMLGVALLTRADDWPTKALGIAIVLAAMWTMLIVPKALARRWRTPPGVDAS